MLKKAKPIFIPRIRMLIELKKSEQEGISKRALAELIGVNHNSIQTWRTEYQKNGIKGLLSHGRTGFKPSVFSTEEQKFIEKKLTDPTSGLRGYSELLQWIEKEFNNPVKYNTLLKHCRRNYDSRVKVARKSHVKKDEQAVNAFKKTSHITVNKSLKKKPTNTKR